MLKVLNATDEFVMAFEATFSNVADSHLVCIQEGTSYKTQSINLEGQERKGIFFKSIVRKIWGMRANYHTLNQLQISWFRIRND